MQTPNNISQVRLLTGDVNLELPYLADDTIQWLLQDKGSVLEAAIEGLEIIINQISLAPESIKTDAVNEIKPKVDNLERRLTELKSRRGTNKKFPMLVRSDRSNWDDFNSLFPKY